jgi:hypothetical protein
LWVFSADFALSQKWPRDFFLFFFENIFSFLKIFCIKIFVLNYFLYGRKSEKKVVVLLTETPKPPESARQKQTHAKLVKSARNWESARNMFCLPDNFQIRQNCSNLAEKTAIWQRWLAWPSIAAFR